MDRAVDFLRGRYPIRGNLRSLGFGGATGCYSGTWQVWEIFRARGGSQVFPPPPPLFPPHGILGGLVAQNTLGRTGSHL